jgi:cytochrome c
VRENRVVHIRVGDVIRSETGRSLWVTEGWYTLNRIPKDRPLAPTAARPAVSNEGWTVLFDGTSTESWRAYGATDAPIKGWEIIDGALTRTSGGGDIMTRDSFADFELELEWTIAEGGNSGVFFRVDPAVGPAWHTGPEMQVLDNSRHPDGRDARTSAGSCYGLIPPPRDASLGPDRWNLVRIVARGSKVEYWLNNTKTVEFDAASDEWAKRVAESKFNDLPQFGRLREGRIVLQDHGDRVAYRNVRVRKL